MKIVMKRITTAGVVLLMLFAGVAQAEQKKFGLALKAGTLGGGLEGTIGISERFNARLGFNYFSYDTDETESNVDYEFDLTLQTLSLLLDWHPMGGGFRISAGAMNNGNDIEADGKARNGIYEIDNTNYTAAQVGTLKGEIDFNSFAPYVGIGYGNAVGKDKKWSFGLDLGVMFQGSADVSFSADGVLANDAAFQADLEAERKQLEDSIDDFEFYPVIMIGVSYKF